MNEIGFFSGGKKKSVVQRIERLLEGVDGAVKVLQTEPLFSVLLLVAGDHVTETLVVGLQLLALRRLVLDHLVLLLHLRLLQLEAVGKLLVGVDEDGDARRELNLFGGLLWGRGGK